ncbi:MAG: hypothetical protein ACLVMC_01265 [[Clostridium] symbiosum]
MSGDTKYETASRFFYISPYWAYVDSMKIKEYGKRYLPFFDEYDQALLHLYANCLTDFDNSYIDVSTIEIDKGDICTKSCKRYYQKEIAEYVQKNIQN